MQVLASTFKWSVSKVKVTQQNDKANVVTDVEWLVQGTDDANNLAAYASGVKTFTLGNSFTPYDQLTEAQVLAWCFEPVVTTWIDRNNVEQSTTNLVKNEGETQVAGQIARQLAQKAAEPALPWVTA